MKSIYLKFVAEAIKKNVENFDYHEIEDLIEIPPPEINYNYAFPCFQLARSQRRAPSLIAEELEKKIKNAKIFHEVKAIGPYLNFRINPSEIIMNIFKNQHDYGKLMINSNLNDTNDQLEIVMQTISDINASITKTTL